MAFVFLNRYLDIVDAIDDEDASTIDNVNFEISDIPQDFPIPESHFLEGANERWFLSIALISSPRGQTSIA
jgi:intraflagellar transport protein 172